MSSADWSLSSAARARFESFVIRTDYCWMWTGAHADGYGVMSLLERGRSAYRAHRLSWEIEHERFVPDGLMLDHTCGVRDCVRPSHLEPVTAAGNTQRALWRTQCSRGHDMTDLDNVYTHTWRNGRECKTCSDQKQRERRARKKEIARV